MVTENCGFKKTLGRPNQALQADDHPSRVAP
jgi:hypothetical protein